MRTRKSAERAVMRAYFLAAVMVVILASLAAGITARAVIELERRVNDSAAAVTGRAEPEDTLAPLTAEIDLEQLREETEPVSRYAGITFTEQEEYMLDCLVYHEARGEPFEGQVAVVEVVFNRVLSPYFPDTVEEVIFQKYGDVWQFSPAPYLYTAEPNETNCGAVWAAYRGLDPITTLETVYFSTSPYNEHISTIIGGHYFCEID
ncbi:MAG: cell wall hydrolase [Oscillospiraceae bacterium]|nr:cell wall hydrolase [Oscillospiraceae bacterium]